MRSILEPIVQSSADTKDFYNETRAVIQLSELTLQAGERLSETEQMQLIACYHFLFNERISSIFDDCHAALWRHFKYTKDTANLLVLFRHSSLLWRLRGREDIEKKYLLELAKIVGDAMSQNVRSLGREAAYYLVRASSAILLS